MAERTCVVCGADVGPRVGSTGRLRKYCSRSCRGRAAYESAKARGVVKPAPRKPTTNHACTQCGGEFESARSNARFCSEKCSRRFYRDSGSPCSEDGCDQPTRARGLCIAHYKRAYPEKNPHRKVMIACAFCGKDHEKHASQTKQYANSFCSYECRDLWRIDHTPARTPRPKPEAPPRPPRYLCDRPRPWPWDGKSCPITEALCLWCESIFLTSATKPRIYCSPDCRRRHKLVRRRGRENATTYGSWTWGEFMHIARRFDYCCAYCGVKPERLDPDHVVPIARGGPNTTANLLPACLMCNSDKRDLLLHEWDAERAKFGKPPRTTAWSVTDTRYMHLTSTRGVGRHPCP